MPVRELADATGAAAKEFESKPAPEVLAWALAEFHPRIALAASFGAEDMVLIDMLMRVNPAARVFTLDTGRLPYETYSLMEAIRQRYGLRVEVHFPRAEAVEAMVHEHGVDLFYRSIELRKLCCGVRKVEPLGQALAGLDAWITGLRREQAVSRTGVLKVEIDADHGGWSR